MTLYIRDWVSLSSWEKKNLNNYHINFKSIKINHYFVVLFLKYILKSYIFKLFWSSILKQYNIIEYTWIK